MNEKCQKKKRCYVIGWRLTKKARKRKSLKANKQRPGHFYHALRFAEWIDVGKKKKKKKEAATAAGNKPVKNAFVHVELWNVRTRPAPLLPSDHTKSHAKASSGTGVHGMCGCASPSRLRTQGLLHY